MGERQCGMLCSCLVTLSMSKSGGELGKGRLFFFFWGCLVLSAWHSESLCMMSYKNDLLWVECQQCSLSASSVPSPVASFWLVVTLWSLKLSLTEFLPSPSYSFSAVYQILVTCSCCNNCTNTMLLKPLLLEEDDVVYCMSEILWNKLLSAKIPFQHRDRYMMSL